MALRLRALIFLAAGPLAGARFSKMANPFQFLQDVRAEAAKITWPTRKETMTTTVMVILMVIFASLFFLAVDQGLRLIVTLILRIGH